MSNRARLLAIIHELEGIETDIEDNGEAANSLNQALYYLNDVVDSLS